MIQFRPLFWLTLFALPAFAVLLTLGTWQLQRMQWKNDLITAFEARSAAPPIGPPAADSLTAESEFIRLALRGTFQHEQETYLTGRTYEGNAGFHVVTPFKLVDGRTVLVNRGWVAEAYRDRSTREFSLIAGEVSVDAILRLPGEKGYFVPENDPDNGFWFTLVPSQIIGHVGVPAPAISSYYADSLRTSEVVTLPIGAKTELNLRNAHLSYAMTWYGIALALVGVYTVFHYQAGRLRFGAAPRG
jgi:surfeit locus 1 family protein